MADFLNSTAFLQEDDRAFLRDMFTRFPHVETGFREYAAVESGLMRPVLAGFALKQQPRSGWKRIGVPDADVQSVANHVGTMLSLAFFLAADDIRRRVQDITLVHDLGEAVIGDFTPHDAITDAEKHRLERLAIELLFENHPQREHFLNAWLEFEAAQTPAAQLAKDIDRLEMIMQAQVYENRYPALKSKLEPFWTYVDQRLLTARGREVFEGLKASGTDRPTALKRACNRPYVRPWTSQDPGSAPVPP